LNQENQVSSFTNIERHATCNAECARIYF